MCRRERICFRRAFAVFLVKREHWLIRLNAYQRPLSYLSLDGITMKIMRLAWSDASWTPLKEAKFIELKY